MPYYKDPDGSPLKLPPADAKRQRAFVASCKELTRQEYVAIVRSKSGHKGDAVASSALSNALEPGAPLDLVRRVWSQAHPGENVPNKTGPQLQLDLMKIRAKEISGEDSGPAPRRKSPQKKAAKETEPKAKET